MNSALTKNITSRIKSFYRGNIYPVIICLIVLLGNFSALEVYFFGLFALLTVGALVFQSSVKPFVISLCTFQLMISLENSPSYPSRSDYYFTGWRLPYLAVIGALLVFGIVFFIVKNRILQKISLKNTPMLLPLISLCVPLLLNGAFSSGWSLSGLLFGAANAFVYFVGFIFIYHGFSREDKAEELVRWVAYIAMLIALVISAQLIHLYLTNENIFVNGSVDKVQVALGWGIWNLIGASLVILIPVIFVGVHNNRYPWLYFAAATLAFIMAVLTMSRNALIFSALTYAVCVIISCFKGKRKKAFRIITLVGVIALIAAGMVLWSRIRTLLGDYFERGFSNNGRFEIWTAAFNNFLDAPVFGNGFTSLKSESFYSFGPVPLMAHNTVLQFLSAMGIFGLVGYGYYVFSLFKPAFVSPNLTKSLLALSLAALSLQSMLDNFIFNFYPVLFVTAVSSVIFKMSEENKTEKTKIEVTDNKKT